MGGGIGKVMSSIGSGGSILGGIGDAVSDKSNSMGYEVNGAPSASPDIAGVVPTQDSKTSPDWQKRVAAGLQGFQKGQQAFQKPQQSGGGAVQIQMPQPVALDAAAYGQGKNTVLPFGASTQGDILNPYFYGR